MHEAAAILDVDGTLVDSNDAHARAWCDAFARHGIAVAFGPVRRAIGMGGDKLMPAVSGIDEGSDRGRAIADTRARLFRDTYLSQVRPFDRVRELLERLRGDGFTLAVASSAKQDELAPLLEIAGVQDLIQTRTSSDDAEGSKPEPDIVVAALARARCAPAHAVMLGDTPYDVEAARRAGVRIVAVECGGWPAADLDGAVAVYASPSDLLHEYDRSIFRSLKAERQHAEA